MAGRVSAYDKLERAEKHISEFEDARNVVDHPKP